VASSSATDLIRRNIALSTHLTQYVLLFAHLKIRPSTSTAYTVADRQPADGTRTGARIDAEDSDDADNMDYAVGMDDKNHDTDPNDRDQRPAADTGR
jgi:hypothetical protein